MNMKNLAYPLAELGNGINQGDKLVTRLPLQTQRFARNGIEHQLSGRWCMSNIPPGCISNSPPEMEREAFKPERPQLRNQCRRIPRAN